MTTKQKFNLVNELVEYFNKLGTDSLSINVYEPSGTIEIKPNYSLSGCFIKDFAALCSAFNWTFGIYTDLETNRPYIHLCA